MNCDITVRAVSTSCDKEHPLLSMLCVVLYRVNAWLGRHTAHHTAHYTTPHIPYGIRCAVLYKTWPSLSLWVFRTPVRTEPLYVRHTSMLHPSVTLVWTKGGLLVLLFRTECLATLSTAQSRQDQLVSQMQMWFPAIQLIREDCKGHLFIH